MTFKTVPEKTVKKLLPFPGCLIVLLIASLFVFNQSSASSSENYFLDKFINKDTFDFGLRNFIRKFPVKNRATDTVVIRNDDLFLAGGISRSNKTYTLFIKDSVLLDNKKWTVNPSNKIVIQPQGISINNFSLNRDSSIFSLNSNSGLPNAPVTVALKQMDLRDIRLAINADTSLSGITNGQFVIGEFSKPAPSVIGNVNIPNLAMNGQPVGLLNISSKKIDDNTISLTGDLTGNGNIVKLTGQYFLNNPRQQMDANIVIDSLSLAAIQAFTGDRMKDARGSVNGNIGIRGLLEKPTVNGQLNFDSVLFSGFDFGAKYFIDRQKLSVVYPNVVFNNFTIRDSINHEMLINGNLKLNAGRKESLNLKVQAKDFLLFNMNKAIANQLYGLAVIDADVVVTGTIAKPVVKGKVVLNNESEITLVLPERNVNKDAATSIVRFIDHDTFPLPEKVNFKQAVQPKTKITKFINYDLEVSISKNAALNIVIDPSSGDLLRVKGHGKLNAGVDTSGNILLVGTYDLDSGYYELNNQYLNKQFVLLPGSMITFKGKPVDALIDITAEYVANTASSDLLGNEVGEVSRSIQASFNDRIPYRVLLKLQGTMLKPEISFNILPPADSVQMNPQLRNTVKTKLDLLRENQAGTNKQVFSLLLMNRFVGEQSTDFFKSNGLPDGGFNGLARESVTKFLSSAIDQIANDLFKGIDIDLALNTYKDYGTGDAQDKSELKKGVTKNFLNDRISITVGKNYGIDGQDGSAKSAKQKGSGFLPDVTLNYKLTQDGKYLMRSYKKNQTEVILDGYVLETGVAFLLRLDYDVFKDLFNRQKNKPIRE